MPKRLFLTSLTHPLTLQFWHSGQFGPERNDPRGHKLNTMCSSEKHLTLLNSLKANQDTGKHEITYFSLIRTIYNVVSKMNSHSLVTSQSHDWGIYCNNMFSHKSLEQWGCQHSSSNHTRPCQKLPLSMNTAAQKKCCFHSWCCIMPNICSII